MASRDRSAGLDATDTGHPLVHDHHPRCQLAHRIDRVLAGTHLADQRKTFAGSHEITQRVAKGRVIVGDKDRDRTTVAVARADITRLAYWHPRILFRSLARPNAASCARRSFHTQRPR